MRKAKVEDVYELALTAFREGRKFIYTVPRGERGRIAHREVRRASIDHFLETPDA